MKRNILIILLVLFTSNAYAFSLDDAYKAYLYGDYQEALYKARRLRENDQVLYFLGLIYTKTTEYSKARAYLRRLLKKYPHSQIYEQALVKLADTYFLEGNLTRAKALYKEIKDKYPSLNQLPLVILRLAQIASKEGDWQEKRRYLKILKKKYPQAPEMKFAGILSSLEDFFTIQVGAFSQKRNALGLKKELEQKGYPVYIVVDRKKDYTLYKIRIGKYKGKEEAQKIYLKLLDQGYPARIYP